MPCACARLTHFTIHDRHVATPSVDSARDTSSDSLTGNNTEKGPTLLTWAVSSEEPPPAKLHPDVRDVDVFGLRENGKLDTPGVVFLHLLILLKSQRRCAAVDRHRPHRSWRNPPRRGHRNVHRLTRQSCARKSLQTSLQNRGKCWIII